MLTTSERKLLTAYRELHKTRQSSFRFVLMGLRPLLILSCGLVIPAVLNCSIFFARVILPFWALLLLSWAPFSVIWIGMFYLQGRKWPVVDSIIDWDRVNELLDEDDATD